jgi:hypothetical protein
MYDRMRGGVPHASPSAVAAAKLLAILFVGASLGSTYTTVVMTRSQGMMKEEAVKQCIDLIGKVGRA